MVNCKTKFQFAKVNAWFGGLFLDLCLMENRIGFERELFTDNTKDDCEEVLTAKYTLL